MSTALPSVSLFMPIYNEAALVEPVVRKAVTVLEAIGADFEVIVVDDGSIDGSGAIADAIAAADARVRVIHHGHNQGYGQALRTGFAAGTRDVVVYTDIDEPADLWLLREALPHLATHDLVIGYRIDRTGTPRRRAFTWGYNTLVRVLFGVRVRDINFSFKLIRRDALRAMHLGASSVFIDGELLVEAKRLDLRIVEIPVRNQERTLGTSHFDGLRSATDTLQEIARYWARRRAR
jgi:glycosyltransferase involved in cell wall biosynthesis